MAELFELNSEHSTTRLVTREVPTIEEPPDAAFKTVLFLPEGEGRQGKGGLRTQGYFKRSLPDKPLITVITVVFNGAQHLEETILSVIGQTYDNVEYIVVDGASTDGTLDIIRKYEHAIDYWVSENDGGIYYAMNKGIDLATGIWINFMNAGDWLYSNQVLSSVFDGNNYSNIEIIYGNHEVRYPSGRKRVAKAGKLKNLWKGSQFSHQSAFVGSLYHKKNKFNCCINLVADFYFFYLAWIEKKYFFALEKKISSVAAMGISDIRRIDSIIARWNIIDKKIKNNIWYLFVTILELFKIMVKYLLNIFPCRYR